MADKDTSLASRYAPTSVEPRVYERWLASGAFTPAEEPTPGAVRFVITMPPPNVTGSLHTGHALFVTAEDILIRYHRMRGDDTLWVPGVDHASIAAQFVLDKLLAVEGLDRASLGREAYLDRMWAFMDETRDRISLQLRRLGASADWSRNRFTMDEGSARAVRVAFKRLSDAGYVYRGEALGNWCPRCRTTISDLENIHRDEVGTLWTIRYHLVGGDGAPDPEHWISVATTRPETLLGDMAVAVHPEDERYRDLVGREAVLPFLGRRLPIIADTAVDPTFGTGAVKITPAHDPDDYETGKRHGLTPITILDEEARINEAGGEFAGLDRFDARQRIVERLTALGDLEGEVAHPMVVGHCERCGTVIEPRLSVQWFIRTADLAARALASVREGRTRIMPPRFEKVYAHWMENIRDWAVGRQLWWGHRIPAWFCPDGHFTISDEADGPSACETCGRTATELTQETDIFDTWFSSGLWPFSTLGWPDDTPDLRRFYPTSVMETGYDILFFWVARMMMLGLFLTDAEPFRTVFLHGLVRAEGGVKMSKTKGNVTDPVELIDEIGADAVRLALTSGTSAGNDQRLTMAKLDGARNFANKLWNAARFVLGSEPIGDSAEEQSGPAGASMPERWIRSRLAAITADTTQRLDRLDLGGYAAAATEFAWNDFCDWYLELAKIEMRDPGASSAARSRSWQTAVDVLADTLRLLHPVMPFVTEEIWSAIAPARQGAGAAEPDLLMTSPWPTAGPRDAAAEAEFTSLAEVIRTTRTLRTEAGIPAGAIVELHIAAASTTARAALEDGVRYLEPMARARTELLPADAPIPDGRGAATALGAVWLGDASEVAPTAAAGTDREAELRVQRDRVRALLADAAFLERAPAAVVDRERVRLADLEERLRQIGTGDGSG
ncbi:MAG TPA: valine--tRNA ligase [Candidatus Limnocylindria bacterium]|jgi:valyl-tRNA synthetase|nr:valine--tRNA ligase [Candidatus Limnocylindria bacterium]